MICDAIIIIWFIVYTFLLNKWINAEKQASEKLNVEMTDFACRIKRLPHIESMDQLEELKAALTGHIERIVNNTEEVFVGREYNVPPSEIVSINFAFRSFGNYQKLLEIEQLVQ